MERLDGGPAARSSRRPWLAVGIAVVVLAGLGAIRLTGLGPPPSPSVPTRSPTTDASTDTTSWPAGVGFGTLYAVDEVGVASIDLGSGLVQRSDLDVSGTAAQLTAFGGGALVWPATARGKTRFVGSGSTDAFAVGGLVAQARGFLPGGGGDSVWVSPTDVASSRRSTWQLVDAIDAVRPRASVEVRGDVVGDGSGGLFDQDDFHVRHVRPGGGTRQWDGFVLAVGPDGYETETCVRDVCRTLLHDRATGREAPLGRVVSPGLALGALSPGNRFVATVEPQSADDPDGADVVRVAEPGSERVLRSFPASNRTQQLQWVSDRWLVADSRDGLVLYDAVDDRLVTPATGLSRVTSLAFQPA